MGCFEVWWHPRHRPRNKTLNELEKVLKNHYESAPSLLRKGSNSTEEIRRLANPSRSALLS